MQTAPGIERKMKPKPDHGEKSYQGSKKLDGLAAIITGGDSGIGRAVAIAFAREGADVAIGYLSEKEEKDARDTISGWRRPDGVVLPRDSTCRTREHADSSCRKSSTCSDDSTSS